MFIFRNWTPLARRKRQEEEEEEKIERKINTINCFVV
jgi:hypothetical protein